MRACMRGSTCPLLLNNSASQRRLSIPYGMHATAHPWVACCRYGMRLLVYYCTIVLSLFDATLHEITDFFGIVFLLWRGLCNRVRWCLQQSGVHPAAELPTIRAKTKVRAAPRTMHIAPLTRGHWLEMGTRETRPIYLTPCNTKGARFKLRFEALALTCGRMFSNRQALAVSCKFLNSFKSKSRYGVG